MAFSNYEWIAEGFAKIAELERRIVELEAQIKALTENNIETGDNK